MIGKSRQLLVSHNTSQNSGFGTTPSRDTSSGVSETIDYDCPPSEFQLLRTGGPRHAYEVDAIVYQGGRLWSNGKSWIKTYFKRQN